jgi:hypothetical protein
MLQPNMVIVIRLATGKKKQMYTQLYWDWDQTHVSINVCSAITQLSVLLLPNCSAITQLIWLTYGSETWNWEGNLNFFERKILKWIFGSVRETEMWRIRYSEHHRAYNSLDLVLCIKLKRLQWAGYVQRLYQPHTQKSRESRVYWWSTTGETQALNGRKV